MFSATLLLMTLAGGANDEWPTAGWRQGTPAAEGLDAAALERLSGEFAAGKHGYVDCMLVIRHGRLVFERVLPPRLLGAVRQGARPSPRPLQLLRPGVASLLPRRASTRCSR